MQITLHLYRSTLQRGEMPRASNSLPLVYANFQPPDSTAWRSPASW